MKKIIVLSRNPEAEGTARLVNTAKERSDLLLIVLDPHLIEMHQLEGKASLKYESADLDVASVPVIPRLSSLCSEYSLLVLRHLELCGGLLINSYSGISSLRFKFHSLQEMARAGIPVPDTSLLRDRAGISPAVEALGGYPVIVKYLRGNQGAGVVFAENPASVHSMIDALNAVGFDAMLQRYYPAGAKQDTRVIVVGDKARWAVRRSADEIGFRSNFHRGGTFEPTELLPKYAELAEKASALFSLRLAGIDIIEDNDGQPMVLEVNTSPGFATAAGSYGEEVPNTILDYALGLTKSTGSAAGN